MIRLQMRFITTGLLSNQRPITVAITVTALFELHSFCTAVKRSLFLFCEYVYDLKVTRLLLFHLTITVQN